MIIDSHAHLYLEPFDKDLEEVIYRAKKAGVSEILLPNIDDTTIESLLAVCNQWVNYCYPLMGLHPTSVDQSFERRLSRVKEELVVNESRYVGIGEIGIDLYWDKAFKEEQLYVFEEQVKWALNYQLPVAIHCREAFNEVFEVLDKYDKVLLTGVFHSFTGTKKELEKALSYPGFYIGINGIVTFKNSLLTESISLIPLERLLIETDSPYLAPVPLRGKRNESSFIVHTLDNLANCYNLPPEELGNITIKNTKKLFGKLK